MYGQTSGVIVGANSNRLKIKESIYAAKKSKARKVPAPEIAKPPAKTPLFFFFSAYFWICMCCVKMMVWSRKTTNEKKNRGRFQTTGFVKL